MTLYGRFEEMVDSVLAPPGSKPHAGPYTFADFFCGIGGFHVAASNLGLECVFACDLDPDARAAYQHNFGTAPEGDVMRVKAGEVPDHDLLFAGFPCQPFSIIGQMKGLGDVRGTLFFEVIRILRVKRPRGVVLENVKQFATAGGGAILKRLLDDLRGLGYTVDWRILNALDFGLPQKRERILIVGTLPPFAKFPWPTERVPMKPLAELLEPNPDKKHFVSERIRKKRQAKMPDAPSPTIWHENKGGHISAYPYSCALRAGASYNYLLVDGVRRLTPREMLRLQGFPDSFEIIGADSQVRKQAGNAVPVPLIQAAIGGVVDVIRQSEAARWSQSENRPVSVGPDTGRGSS